MNAPVFIVGAGIGGLTSALALAAAGFKVELFEQSAYLSEVGAGLQLSPNASRVLIALGLEQALADNAFEPEAAEVRHWRSGNLLSRGPLADKARKRWGAAYYHIHRADLQQLLLAAVRDNAKIRLHLNAPCKAVTALQDAVSLTLANGDSHHAPLLIGADGIHSKVRQAVLGDERPSFTGHVAWRFMIPIEQLPADLVPPVAGLWMGPKAHFVHYYVAGQRYVNCAAVVEQSAWQEESWTQRGDKQDLLDSFSGWHPFIQQLLAAADEQHCYRWGLFDRRPSQQWCKGRIALLGDACHPTLPFLAQGAAMAIEDAAVLAQCLSNHAGDHVSGHTDIQAALTAYTKQRQARVARVQNLSRRNGRIYHLTGLPAVARNLALRLGLVNPLKTMDWLYSQ